MNGSIVKTAPEIGKVSDAEQIEGKEMAGDQLLNYECAAWVIFLFSVFHLASSQGKLRLYPSFQRSPVDISVLYAQKPDSATRINACFPGVDQMQDQ